MTGDTISTSHGDIFVKTYGKGRQDVLLIHGNSTSQRCFKHLVEDEELLERYRITTLDLLGFGKSSNAIDPAKSYSFPGFADAAIQVVRQQGIKSVIIYGHSMGGHTVINAVRQLADAGDIKVLGYMITGSPPASKIEEFQESFNIDAGNNDLRSAVAPGDALRQMVQAVFGPSVDEFMLEDAQRADSAAKEHVFSSGLSPDAPDQRKIVREITSVPLAIVNGANDSFIKLDVFEKLQYGNLWKGKTFNISGSGHAPFWDQPEKFLPLFKDFLDNVRE